MFLGFMFKEFPAIEKFRNSNMYNDQFLTIMTVKNDKTLYR